MSLSQFIDKISSTWQWQNPQYLKVWLWLMGHADDTGAVSFRISRLSRDLAITRQAIHRVLKRANETGEIVSNTNGDSLVKNDADKVRTKCGHGVTTLCIRNISEYTVLFSTCGQSADKVRTETDPNSPLLKVKKPKAKKEPEPKLVVDKKRTLVDEYHDLHIEKIGFKPHILGPRDMQAMKRVLNTCGSYEEVVRRLECFFDDPLDFMTKPQWTTKLFETMVNKYATVASHKPEDPDF